MTIYEAYQKSVRVHLKNGIMLEGVLDWMEGPHESEDERWYGSVKKTSFSEDEVESIEEIDKPE